MAELNKPFQTKEQESPIQSTEQLFQVMVSEG